MVSTVDVNGGGVGFNIADTIDNFTRSKNFMIHHGRTATRSIDYRGWLVETIDHPYMSTIEFGGSTREFYAEQRAPSIAFASGFTISIKGECDLLIIHSKASYQFRGRRMDNAELASRRKILTP